MHHLQIWQWAVGLVTNCVIYAKYLPWPEYHNDYRALFLSEELWKGECNLHNMSAALLL